ncbi:MAG: alpha/beta-hydrolase family protein [Planctomycetota bacterium]
MPTDGTSNFAKRHWLRLCRFCTSLSLLGLFFAGTLFAISLTPSLLPRVYVVQGLLSGIAMATGYGIGVFIQWSWGYLELPVPRGRTKQVLCGLAFGGMLILANVFLWRASIWQNSIRELMGMEPVATAYPVRITLIAVLFATLLLTVARSIIWCSRQVDRRVRRFVPRRVSYAITTIIVSYLIIVIVNGVLAKTALKAADNAFLRIDRVIDEEIPQPESPLASGSSDSLIPWETIGRWGKEFIVAEPNQEQLSEFSGTQAMEPLRVYVGLRSAETPEERATLALEELKRVGGFERSVLVVATPTGTGWLDPGAVHSLEYIHRGDTAIVSMQYSYLPSWMTILVDPDRSRRTATALFDQVYEYWRTLPADQRPRLYLHGLSLGALGSETCADLFTLFQDPIQGALWSGPPFPSKKWSTVSTDRNPNSPIWLPTFRDGSMVRFTGQTNALNGDERQWGPMRFVYIQYASDPMTFFSPDLLFHRPAWLQGERGPDVSPYLDWYPIVTFLQVAGDLPMATSVPQGHGHNIAPENYIDGWIAVTEPKGWSASDTQRLKALMTKDRDR